MTARSVFTKKYGACQMKIRKIRKLTDLERAFAHNNGIELLADRDLIYRLEQGNAHTIADTWFQEFTNVHRRLFFSRTFNHDSERPGIISKGLGRTVSPVLDILVKQLYDKEGFAKRPRREDLVRYLADAYKNLSDTELFEVGGDETLRTFFTLIGKTKALTDSNGLKLDIDFTRLDPEHILMLRKKPEDYPDDKDRFDDMDKVFKRLLDASKNRDSTNLRFHERWCSLPKSETGLAQKHFLSHTHDNAECLVAINGGLVPLDAVEGDITHHIHRGGHPADFMVSRKQIIYYLIEGWRETASNIDGIPITDDAIPLFPLNVDLLTGLDVTTQLPDVKEYCRQHNTHILRLPQYIHDHKDDFAGLPDSLKKRLKHAEKRVIKTREIIWKSVNEVFEGKSPVGGGEEPKIFMTMGGTGSGKSNLAAIARKHTNGNFVQASLDEARTRFSVYELYAKVGRELSEIERARNNGKQVRTGHHFGDYIALETAAGFIREGIVERAKGYHGNHEEIPNPKVDEHKRYHLLYDGSGIPYKGKYDKIIKELRKKGFGTYVLVADAPIDKAYARARERLKGADGRAVPPKVIVEKHRGLPRSMRDAARDEYVDYFEILDTTQDGIGNHYTLAHRKKMPLAKVKELEDARRTKTERPDALYEALHRNNFLPEDLHHAPEGWQQRVEFVVVDHNHHAEERYSKVLIITDAERMAAISRKGALNPDASGLKDLWSLHQPFELLEECQGRGDEQGGSTCVDLALASSSLASDPARVHEQSEAEEPAHLFRYKPKSRVPKKGDYLCELCRIRLSLEEGAEFPQCEHHPGTPATWIPL